MQPYRQGFSTAPKRSHVRGSVDGSGGVDVTELIRFAKDSAGVPLGDQYTTDDDDTVFNRLHGARLLYDAKKEAMRQVLDMENTFRPKINRARSVSLGRARPQGSASPSTSATSPRERDPSKSLFEHLHEDQKKIAHKMQKKREEKIKEGLEQCTFTPQRIATKKSSSRSRSGTPKSGAGG